MATITFHDSHGAPLKRFEPGVATKAALASLNIASASWALQPQPVSARLGGGELRLARWDRDGEEREAPLERAA